jgi:hypothetical protein
MFVFGTIEPEKTFESSNSNYIRISVHIDFDIKSRKINTSISKIKVSENIVEVLLFTTKRRPSVDCLQIECQQENMSCKKGHSQ